MFEWLQITPFIVNFELKTETGRPTTTGPLHSYLRWIPSISAPSMKLNGILITDISAIFKTVFKIISDEYNTSLFSQIIQSMGRTGLILEHLGITRSIAGFLEISQNVSLSPPKLLNNNLSKNLQFAEIENQIFGNRNEWINSLSQENIFDLGTKLQKFKIRSNDIIGGFIAKADMGFEIRERNISGGIFGLLNNEKYFDMVASKGFKADNNSISEAERKRTPRAFPGNVIRSYHTDELISTAQTMIQRKGSSISMIKERIRYTVRCTLTKNFVCLTDHFVVVLKPDLSQIVLEIEIKHISNIKVIATEVRIEGKKEKEKLSIRCQYQDIAIQLGMILNSQRIIDIMFLN